MPMRLRLPLMAALRGRLLDRVSGCKVSVLRDWLIVHARSLPSEGQQHPQFALLSGNLVPSCGPGNTRKGRLVVDESTYVPCFLHPYFDKIPDLQFLHVDVAPLSDALGLIYRLARPNGIDPTDVPTPQHPLYAAVVGRPISANVIGTSPRSLPCVRSLLWGG